MTKIAMTELFLWFVISKFPVRCVTLTLAPLSRTSRTFFSTHQYQQYCTIIIICINTFRICNQNIYPSKFLLYYGLRVLEKRSKTLKMFVQNSTSCSTIDGRKKVQMFDLVALGTRTFSSRTEYVFYKYCKVVC